MKNKTEILKEMYKTLKEGKIVEICPDDVIVAETMMVKNKKYKTWRCTWKNTGKCWLKTDYRWSRPKSYICWRCAGQSANDMSLQNLRWICKNIAKSTDYYFRVADNCW